MDIHNNYNDKPWGGNVKMEMRMDDRIENTGISNGHLMRIAHLQMKTFLPT